MRVYFFSEKFADAPYIRGDFSATSRAKLFSVFSPVFEVVNMMKTVEDLVAGELQMFDSIKALEGFTSIHHLLLAFCDKYPDIVTTATQRGKKLRKMFFVMNCTSDTHVWDSLLFCLYMSFLVKRS